jgi:hypothetical protein
MIPLVGVFDETMVRETRIVTVSAMPQPPKIHVGRRLGPRAWLAILFTRALSLAIALFVASIAVGILLVLIPVLVIAALLCFLFAQAKTLFAAADAIESTGHYRWTMPREARRTQRITVETLVRFLGIDLDVAPVITVDHLRRLSWQSCLRARLRCLPRTRPRQRDGLAKRRPAPPKPGKTRRSSNMDSLRH